MKLAKPILALFLTVVTLVSLTACSDTTWAFKYGENQTISSGLYIFYMMDAYNNVASDESLDSQKDLWGQSIDGKPVKDLIIEKTEEYCDQYIAIENKFEELELTLSEDDLAEIDNTAANAWASMGGLYWNNSVSEATMKTAMTNNQKRTKIFKKYYEKGGIEEVSDANLLVHYKENFARVTYFGLAMKVGTEETPLTDADKKYNEELKEKAETYAKLYNDDKNTMGELADTYGHFLNGDEHDDSNTEDVIQKDEDIITEIKNDSTSPSEEVVKAMFKDMKPDETAKVLSDDSSYYVAVRFPLFEDDVEKMDSDKRTEMLYDVKSEDFVAMLEEWGKTVAAPEKNAASIGRYVPQNLKFS